MSDETTRGDASTDEVAEPAAAKEDAAVVVKRNIEQARALLDAKKRKRHGPEHADGDHGDVSSGAGRRRTNNPVARTGGVRSGHRGG